MRANFRRWGLPVAAFLAYTLIAFVVLRTLTAQFTTAVPGGRDTDYYQFMWNYWWMRFAFAHGQSPLWTNYVFYPHVSNLSIHTLAAVWYPVYTVVEPLLGRVAALNTMIVLAFSLSGTAMFAWLRRKLADTNAMLALDFVGGVAFAFSPYLMVHSSYAQLNLTPLWWFPLLLLLWDEIASPRWLPRRVTAILLGLALWGVVVTDLQFLVWVPFVVAPYALWTLWTLRRERRWLAPVICGVVALAGAGVLSWFYPLAALREVNLNPAEYPPAGLTTLYHYSLPPAALFGLAPNEEVRTLGHVLPVLFWAVLILLVWRRRSRERGRFPLLWLLLIVPPLLMAFGPDIEIAGVHIPTGYMLLHELLKGQHRIPSRFTGAVITILITFLALAWSPLVVRWWQRRRALTIAALIAVSFALLYDVGGFDAFPVRALPEYDIFHRIAKDPRQYVVFDVPVGVQYGWTGIGKGFLAMYYSQVHEHPIVNGWLARIPYSTLDYYQKQPLFAWLAGVQTLNANEKREAATNLASLVKTWPVGYVFAYRDWMSDAQQNEWIGWLNEQPEFCPAQQSPDSALLWWKARALGCDPFIEQNVLQIGNPADWRAIGTGWYTPERIGETPARWSSQDSTLRLTLDPARSYELTFSAVAFGKGRTVSLSADRPLGDTIALADDDWHEYTINIPVGADPLLRLHHNGAESPGVDPRLLAAAYRWFTLRAK